MAYPKNCLCADFENGLIAYDCHVHNKFPMHFVGDEGLECNCDTSEVNIAPSITIDKITEDFSRGVSEESFRHLIEGRSIHGIINGILVEVRPVKVLE